MSHGLSNPYARHAGATLDSPRAPVSQATGSPRPLALAHPVRIRMAYLVSRYPSVSHTFILREVRQLRKQGFAIEVASVNEPDREQARMTADEQQETACTYYLKRHGLRGALAAHLAGLRHPVQYLRGLRYALSLGGLNPARAAYGLFYFTEALMLARWMSQRGLDHLHVHFATAAANIGLILKHSHGIGLSLTVHGPDEFYDVPGQWLVEKLKAADFVVCIGRFARSQVMKLTPASHWGKFEVCPLGVDPQQYLPTDRADEPRTFTILCVGRLTPAKGQRILIEAAGRLARAGLSFQVVMIGAGPDEADLRSATAEQGLDDRIIFTGALNQQEVLDWYAVADAFALPSFAEGIPVVLMEAMASGVPCVTTRITGIPELIRDGVDGLLVTPSDSSELAEALERLMRNPELRRRLALKGREKVCEGYNLERNATALAEVFAKRLEMTP